MKRKNKILSIIFLILTCILTSCGTSTQKSTHPSNYEQLSNLIGLTKEHVCDHLTLSQDELKNISTGLYLLPKKIEYEGYPFDVFLTFDATEGEEILYGFWYRTTFEKDTQEAADFTTKLAERFAKSYTKWEVYETSNYITEQDDLIGFLNSKGICTAAETFDLSGQTNDTIKDYISSYLQANEIELQYGLILEVTSTEDSTITVSLKYEMATNSLRE